MLMCFCVFVLMGLDMFFVLFDEEWFDWFVLLVDFGDFIVFVDFDDIVYDFELVEVEVLIIFWGVFVFDVCLFVWLLWLCVVFYVVGSIWVYVIEVFWECGILIIFVVDVNVVFVVEFMFVVIFFVGKWVFVYVWILGVFCLFDEGFG